MFFLFYKSCYFYVLLFILCLHFKLASVAIVLHQGHVQEVKTLKAATVKLDSLTVVKVDTRYNNMMLITSTDAVIN